MEEFCLGIFANADKADRDSPTQPPEINLAGRFYVSSLFFDVLTQFHPDRVLPPDLEEKRRYAKYRTLQIRNRKPLDAPAEEPTAAPVVQSKLPISSKPSTHSSGFQYADSGSESGSPPKPSPPAAPRQATSSSRPPTRAPSVVVPVEAPATQGGAISHSNAQLAKKRLQQAISAIDFEDYATACALSVESMKLLTPK